MGQKENMVIFPCKQVFAYKLDKQRLFRKKH